MKVALSEPKNMKLFKKAQFEGGYIEFNADVEQAIVIKRMKGMGKILFY